MARSQRSGGGYQRARLIHQANYLLDRQLHELERHFIEVGGSEGLAAAVREAAATERI